MLRRAFMFWDTFRLIDLGGISVGYSWRLWVALRGRFVWEHTLHAYLVCSPLWLFYAAECSMLAITKCRYYWVTLLTLFQSRFTTIYRSFSSGLATIRLSHLPGKSHFPGKRAKLCYFPGNPGIPENRFLLQKLTERT
jgi:hypothetical protein